MSQLHLIDTLPNSNKILTDIVVSAVGIPKEHYITDVGIKREFNIPSLLNQSWLKIMDFEGIREKARYITPITGNTGHMTAVMLINNTINAAKNVQKLLRSLERN